MAALEAAASDRRRIAQLDGLDLVNGAGDRG
jgi:hypothetical protein